MEGAGGGFIQAATKAQERAFSPTGRSNQNEDARLQGQGQSIQRIQETIGAGEGVGAEFHARKIQAAVAAWKRRSSQWEKAEMGRVRRR